MNRRFRQTILWIAVLLIAAPSVWAQRGPSGRREPHVGYVYPAGGLQGTELDVTIGGQFLDGASRVVVSGGGVASAVLKHKKPLNGKEINEIRELLDQARQKLEATHLEGEQRGRRAPFAAVLKEAEQLGADAEKLETFLEFRRARNDPKVQENAQLAEKVILHLKLADDAEPGRRELRLMTAAGLTNPLAFHVGQLPEYTEHEPNDERPDTGFADSLPVVFNGQIMPGDVDRFAFRARRSQRLVIAAQARQLMPYLADAVPGWFQATVALFDADGHEVAFADDDRFHPDPVLYYVIPKSGQYVLQINDAIYRGREDFVYRVTASEASFVKGTFPLGGQAGTTTDVELFGWNLPAETLAVDLTGKTPGSLPISVGTGRRTSNEVALAVGALREQLEVEPNNTLDAAQQVEPPLIVNGRIAAGDDTDVYSFRGRAGGRVVVEVVARRLGSPLDSALEITDANDNRLAENDDVDDPADGLTTHHADSRLAFTLPADGRYFVHLADAQRHGGADYGYRLRISVPQPDFALRVVPSTISAPAGTSVPITVFALRHDEFAGDVRLSLVDSPAGFSLGGAWIPAGQDKIMLTLAVPNEPQNEPVRLRLAGTATIRGRDVRHEAVPADDMMQAFIYRHLVPAQEWLVTTTARGRRRPMRLVSQQPVQIPAGGSVRIEVAGPARLPADGIHLTLNAPPQGVVLHYVAPLQRGLAILLRSDAEQVKVGTKGNLLIDVAVDRTVPNKEPGKPAQKRRIQWGTLPAISYEIVGAGT